MSRSQQTSLVDLDLCPTVAEVPGTASGPEAPTADSGGVDDQASAGIDEAPCDPELGVQPTANGPVPNTPKKGSTGSATEVWRGRPWP